MSTLSSPIPISSPEKRFSSTSPINKTSNLTFALQQAGRDPSPPPQTDSRQNTMDTRQPNVRSDSLSVPFSTSHSAVRPISMSGQGRRESNVGGSFMGGLSWGGMSIGSYLQDDIMMGGSSPSINSPSLHSSSYLPRMEANFWNNLKCCDTTFENLHELVAHFEDVHKQQPQNFPYAMSGPGSDRLPRRKSSTTNPGDWRGANQIRGFQQGFRPHTSVLDSQRKQSTINMQDMDTIGEMELDDQPINQSEYGFPQQTQAYSSDTTPQMSNAVPNVQALDNHQGFHNSNPATPPTNQHTQPNFNGSLFPSMNQTAFGAQTQQNPQAQSQQFVDDQGIRSAAVNGFHSPYSTNTVPFNSSVLSRLNADFRNMEFGSNNDMVDLCINEPAKNLYSADGGFNAQQYPHFNFTSIQKNGDSTLSNGDENAKKLQAQRLAAGIGRQPTEEERPFKCPVIGCEKAYKNANGLRYHEKHGHSTQKLKENGDGTFSIVDPITSMPYPGTVGMEKEKPYRCEVCGKRYKNLNGLKYHRNHSPPCNPDFHVGNMPNLQQEMDGEAVY